MIKVKRIYDAPASDDGYRVLVDRLWPRGFSKEEARLDSWLRDLAPSDDLRHYFGHDPARWDEFRARYRQELRAPDKQDALRDLSRRARDGVITLLFAAKETERNNAVALKEALDELAGEDHR